jgi:hypothetical protein
VKIVVGYYKFNISTTTHWFQIIILAFGRSISLLQLFDHCNLTNIDPDMSILASRIATQFRGRIRVRHSKCNNSTSTDSFPSVKSALERSTPVDAFLVVDHQNPTSICRATKICVRSKVIQFQLST